jgi:hypothetical protein
MKRAGLTTGMYDVRREDGSTMALHDDYRLAAMRRKMDPEADRIWWIRRDQIVERVLTMRIFAG